MICIKKLGNRWVRAQLSLEEEAKSAKYNSLNGARVGNRTYIIVNLDLVTFLFLLSPLGKVPTNLLKMSYSIRCIKISHSIKEGTSRREFGRSPHRKPGLVVYV